MSKSNIADNLSAKNIVGCTTEMTLWRFVKDIASQLSSLHETKKAHGKVALTSIAVSGKEFFLEKGNGEGSPSADIWHLGACIYELVTGNAPFGGRGRVGQSELSPLPAFSESKASKPLSALMQRCLEYREDERCTAREIVKIAEKELAVVEQYASNSENLKYKKPQNRQVRMKTYSFWPEVMAGIAIMFLLAIPQSVSAQYNAEMEKLIRLTTTMRDQKKRTQVLNELKADTKWTLMDELTVDANECTYKDKVNMFGINDIAAEIAQREKGVVNVGGRFKHSADGKHNYSFIELTAKAGAAVMYTVKAHVGTQQVAVVPFDKNQAYVAVFITENGKEINAHTKKEGISYFTVPIGSKAASYSFEITNNGTKNAAFAVITYNPMK
ncbi:MAG: hypothetical protein MJZ32_09710 [Bacteroidaceae bacterium]|nr:hypothetical protein [Bacteroidaceae bacterium]